MTEVARELLAMAAKAAGINGEHVTTFGGHPAIKRNPHDFTPWNPLADDGDALRLAVKLRLGIEINQRSVIVSWVGGGYETKEIYEYTESIQDDDFDIVHVNHDKATRRAIVRAAAEIGRNM